MNFDDELLTSPPDCVFPGSQDKTSRRVEFLAATRFRFGSLRACLRTDNVEFKNRFVRMFTDCLDTHDAGTDARQIILEVVTSCAPDRIFAEIFPPGGEADGAALSLIFPELKLIPSERNGPGDWNIYVHGSNPRRPVAAMRGNRLVFDREAPWQITVAHYFLNHVMRLQPEMLFFHGATVAMGDRGVLLSGSKGAGKSTLSLALAARGHSFYGDEIAAIEGRTGLISPFRRTVSIRDGPQAEVVCKYLGQHQVDREVLSDGTNRSRVSASHLFPSAMSQPVSLACSFFLAGLADKPHVTAFQFSWRDLPLLAPLHATLTSMSVAERTLNFLNLFRGVRCYILVPGGTPDETAALIENVVEEKWDIASKKKLSVSAPFAG